MNDNQEQFQNYRYVDGQTQSHLRYIWKGEVSSSNNPYKLVNLNNK